jgi:hypothetical protein
LGSSTLNTHKNTKQNKKKSEDKERGCEQHTMEYYSQHGSNASSKEKRRPPAEEGAAQVADREDHLSSLVVPRSAAASREKQDHRGGFSRGPSDN